MFPFALPFVFALPFRKAAGFRPGPVTAHGHGQGGEGEDRAKLHDFSEFQLVPCGPVQPI